MELSHDVPKFLFWLIVVCDDEAFVHNYLGTAQCPPLNRIFYISLSPVSDGIRALWEHVILANHISCVLFFTFASSGLIQLPPCILRLALILWKEVAGRCTPQVAVGGCAPRVGNPLLHIRGVDRRSQPQSVCMTVWRDKGEHLLNTIENNHNHVTK